MTANADLLVALAATMSQEHFKLVIMDSIMAHLRVDFSGRGELSERQQKLGILMSRLRKARLTPRKKHAGAAVSCEQCSTGRARKSC